MVGVYYMARLFIAGDTHGEHDMRKLGFKHFPEGRNLTREDVVIVAGDFGLIFYPTPSPAELWWLAWLKNRPFTVCFVDGNHENHPRLAALPQEIRWGGIVGKVANNIYHLKRGEIYEICGKKILTFGGAQSIDKLTRVEGISWWPEEVPSYHEMDHCLDSMQLHQHKVDIIVGHTCAFYRAQIMCAKYGIFTEKESDPTCRMLEHIVQTCEHEAFYCGHWHVDEDFGKEHFVYDRVLEV